jgi:hypothetical protein
MHKAKDDRKKKIEERNYLRETRKIAALQGYSVSNLSLA